jgi:hypothetical protein
MIGPRPSAAEIELAFYEKFFFSTGLEPYPVQEQAFARIFAGESVLVTVPTGTGKTLMAKAGLFKALALGQQAVYTTPLRALTEEKFRELSTDFGEDKVGFATGDYKVNPRAPVQVVVAEILWNRIFGDRDGPPADVVIVDEGHYFNDPERGYVWEQSIMCLDPRAQLVVLSATVGNPEQFCEWVRSCRRVPMELVASSERRVPLHHEFREIYFVDCARELFETGNYPAIFFTFGRELCFERARLLKSCPRFTSDEERERIAAAADAELLDRGVGRDLRSFLLHGIGIHHAGILPRYKRLVERLTLERLVKFVVSTETISAGINLPAKVVVFPELKKVIKGKPRLLFSAEYHQMAGRAGRPQFDQEGLAITLAPEAVVQEIRKELREARDKRLIVDEERVRKSAYARARAEAQRVGELIWDREVHRKLVEGKPAALRSQTRVTADQVLAIGLPDLKSEEPPESAGAEATPLPVSMRRDIRNVIDHLFLEDREKRAAHRRLDQLVENLIALGIVDEHGAQVAGEMIRELHGVDGPFVWWCLMNHDLHYAELRELTEYLVEHDVIVRLLGREEEDRRREWIRNRLRERRREEPQVTWEDVEEEYEKTFPRELSFVERIHQAFSSLLPHPELHGGKVHKNIWATIEDQDLSFMDYVERQGLEKEEGSLFTYLARVMKTARMLHEATKLEELADLRRRVRDKLATIDARVMEEEWWEEREE